MYNIIFDEEAIDFLEKLVRPERERIFSKIVSAKENPFHFFERLKGISVFRLRSGNYRILADIDKSDKTIHILCIGHRRNVYKGI